MRILCAEVKRFSLFKYVHCVGAPNCFSFFYFHLTFRQIVKCLMCSFVLWPMQIEFLLLFKWIWIPVGWRIELYLLIAWKLTKTIFSQLMSTFVSFIFKSNIHLRTFFVARKKNEFCLNVIDIWHDKCSFQWRDNSCICKWFLSNVNKSMYWKHFPMVNFSKWKICYFDELIMSLIFFASQNRLSCGREISFSYSINQFLL